MGTYKKSLEVKDTNETFFHLSSKTMTNTFKKKKKSPHSSNIQYNLYVLLNKRALIEVSMSLNISH